MATLTCSNGLNLERYTFYYFICYFIYLFYLLFYLFILFIYFIYLLFISINYGKESERLQVL